MSVLLIVVDWLIVVSLIDTSECELLKRRYMEALRIFYRFKDLLQSSVTERKETLSPSFVSCGLHSVKTSSFQSPKCSQSSLCSTSSLRSSFELCHQ